MDVEPCTYNICIIHSILPCYFSLKTVQFQTCTLRKEDVLLRVLFKLQYRIFDRWVYYIRLSRYCANLQTNMHSQNPECSFCLYADILSLTLSNPFPWMSYGYAPYVDVKYLVEANSYFLDLVYLERLANDICFAYTKRCGCAQ